MKNQTSAEQLRNRYKSGESLTWGEIYQLYEALSADNMTLAMLGYPVSGPNLRLEEELEALLKEGK